MSRDYARSPAPSTPGHPAVQRAQLKRALGKPSPVIERLPNVVLIMCDQLRADFLSGDGFPLPTTPALDALAAGGASFRRAYTTSPSCVPARVSLLTGRFPHAHGLYGNAVPGARYQVDLVQVIHDLGYHVALVGKNHSHVSPERFDYVRAYSHAYAPPRGGRSIPELGTNHDAPAHDAFTRWLRRLNHGVASRATPFPVAAQYAARIVDESIAHLKRLGQRTHPAPFFLWMSFPEPHSPYQASEPYFDLFPPETVPERASGPEALATRPVSWAWQREVARLVCPESDDMWRRLRATYCGMLRCIDDQVGRFLRYLDETGLNERTHVLFLADHGDFVGDYGLQRKGVGLSECLIRVPFMWRGPEIVPHVERVACVSLVDVFPTLCDLLGVPLPLGVQGRSLLPLLYGEPYPADEFGSVLVETGVGGLPFDLSDTVAIGFGDAINHRLSTEPGGAPTYDELSSVTMSGRLKAVCSGDWKLVYDWAHPKAAELYNIGLDSTELVNQLADPSPEARARAEYLTAELLRWLIRTEDELPPTRFRLKRHPRNWLFTGEGTVE